MEKPSIEQIGKFFAVHDEGVELLRLFREEKDSTVRSLANLNDCDLRKAAGALEVLQGWLDNLDPPKDEE